MTNKSWIDEKLHRLNSLHPLPEDTKKRLHEELRLQHTYHSNAIEGNTLTPQETKLIIEGRILEGKSFREQREAINTAMAYDIMVEMAAGKMPIDHFVVQRLHEITMSGLLKDAGRYRTKNVRITGATKRPPAWAKVVKLMDEFITEIAHSPRHPVETAAFLHHRFAHIHPFVDGNGRVARLLTNLYLIGQGYLPIIIRVNDRIEYYQLLDAEDPAPFTNYIKKAMAESLDRAIVLGHVMAALKPHLHTIQGLYLHGSRARGDYRADSDYDLLLISQRKIGDDLKTELKKHNVQLECLTMTQVEKQLDLRPSYIATIMREGVPLIGADLGGRLLKKINNVSLGNELEDCRKQLKKLKKMLRNDEIDDVDKSAILYSAVLRLREIYYIKTLLCGDGPGLAEDFKEYYRGDFDRIYGLYQKARDLLPDMEESDVPRGIKRIGKKTLETFVDSVDEYIKDVRI